MTCPHDPSDLVLTLRLLAHPFTGAPMTDCEREQLIAAAKLIEQLTETRSMDELVAETIRSIRAWTPSELVNSDVWSDVILHLPGLDQDATRIVSRDGIRQAFVAHGVVYELTADGFTAQGLYSDWLEDN